MNLLAYATVALAAITAWMAKGTSDLAKANRELIERGERQHRERLRPMCIPLTRKQETIANFEEILNPINRICSASVGITGHAVEIEAAAEIQVSLKNQGLGPALNVRFHFNDIENKKRSLTLRKYSIP